MPNFKMLDRWFLILNAKYPEELNTVTAVNEAGESIFYSNDGVLPETCFLDAEKDFCKLDKLPAIGGELILSKRAFAVLQSVSACPSIQSIPATLRIGNRRRPCKVDPGYRVLTTNVAHDVLDIENSDVKRTKGGHILTINQWSLDPELMPSFDLFLTTTHKWIISGNVVNLIERYGLTGFYLSELL